MSGSRKRILKVYRGDHGSYPYKPRPYIRLCGDYLQQMNFKIGDIVEVEVMNSQIVITKTLKPH